MGKNVHFLLLVFLHEQSIWAHFSIVYTLGLRRVLPGAGAVSGAAPLPAHRPGGPGSGRRRPRLPPAPAILNRYAAAAGPGRRCGCPWRWRGRARKLGRGCCGRPLLPNCCWWPCAGSAATGCCGGGRGRCRGCRRAPRPGRSWATSPSPFCRLRCCAGGRWM